MDSCQRCGVGIEGGYYCQTCGQILAKRRERRAILDKILDGCLPWFFWLFSALGFLSMMLAGICLLQGCRQGEPFNLGLAFVLAMLAVFLVVIAEKIEQAGH